MPYHFFLFPSASAVLYPPSFITPSSFLPPSRSSDALLCPPPPVDHVRSFVHTASLSRFLHRHRRDLLFFLCLLYPFIVLFLFLPIFFRPCFSASLFSGVSLFCLPDYLPFFLQSSEYTKMFFRTSSYLLPFSIFHAVLFHLFMFHYSLRAGIQNAREYFSSRNAVRYRTDLPSTTTRSFLSIKGLHVPLTEWPNVTAACWRQPPFPEERNQRIDRS